MHTANTGTRLVTRTRAPSVVVIARVTPIIERTATGTRISICNGRGVLMTLKYGK